jgi:hypothetical protein
MPEKANAAAAVAPWASQERRQAVLSGTTSRGRAAAVRGAGRRLAASWRAISARTFSAEAAEAPA